jgi:hypothetical protein
VKIPFLITNCKTNYGFRKISPRAPTLSHMNAGLILICSFFEIYFNIIIACFLGNAAWNLCGSRIRRICLFDTCFTLTNSITWTYNALRRLQSSTVITLTHRSSRWSVFSVIFSYHFVSRLVVIRSQFPPGLLLYPTVGRIEDTLFKGSVSRVLSAGSQCFLS